MSFNIGLSGLRTTSQSLDVISQNIANVSTAGFKAGRAELAALYSGGQPGGVEMSNVSQNFSKDGSKQFSGRDLDMAISGQGFFMVNTMNGEERYTRAGMFSRDENNYIVNASGMKLQGYPANEDGSIREGDLTDLQIQVDTLDAKASTELNFKANFKADAPVIDGTAFPFDPEDANSYNFSYSSSLYDSLGNEHTLSQYFVKNGTNQWTAHYHMNGEALMKTKDDGSYPKDVNGDDVITPESSNLFFSDNGDLLTPPEIPLVYNPEHSNSADVEKGAAVMSIDLNLAGTTQFAGDFNVTRNSTDGYESGEFNSLRVDENGIISAVYTNGRTKEQGQVAIASVTNPSGLVQADSTTWSASFAAGDITDGKPGAGSRGTLTPGAYEDSNVDLTGELVNLMTAQRNYQANAKSVSTADQLTQVLFNNM